MVVQMVVQRVEMTVESQAAVVVLCWDSEMEQGSVELKGTNWAYWMVEEMDKSEDSRTGKLLG